MGVPMSGVVVSYESPNGDEWSLLTPDRAPRSSQPVRIVEDGVQGLVGRVEREETESITGYGVRSLGWRTPPLEITLEYVLRSEPGELETLSRAWRQAWEFEQPGDYFDVGPAPRPGKLRVWSPVSEYFWTPVTDPQFPDWPNSLRSARRVRESMSCRGRLGHWFGDVRRFTGAATVRVPGDKPLSPSCRLVWDGSATSVTFPSGLTVNLPAIGVTRYINLDRGMSGQMTRPDGTVDTGGWSSLQGVVSGISLRPNVDSSWVLGPGLTLEVTPRYLSPWR